ncbi:MULTISPECIES: Dps family protein [Cellulomonas]|uniref:DNA starvation/stationary phase protection protein n=1 Tax=Cellulomonas oligotrophica TaxID=931536 RepID=A0A7Y9FIA5_9CELL|nr:MULTISPECIES: DNA starvation/stationary phase protection protein [Cellulomonas]NYD86476.1 starvation-inducible DNA-binding protein [Cellulomonas oligotrophica]TQL02395.1 starvation-inducible DNA-binding protein [Cellulomonas sp. SLBN-39]GIG32633.1 DNA starvation/stationary phase protection protein [Cellulomonas oligotrophica]
MTSTTDRPDVPVDVPTDLQNAENGFTASTRLGDHLQAVLADLVELANLGKQAHWNVVGPNFRDTHLHLDEIVEEAREHADVVAERMRALHFVPDGRTATVAQTTTVAPYPAGEVSTRQTVDLVTAAVERTVQTMRRVHDDVDQEDPTSADLLHAAIAELEKLAWMLAAENRTPDPVE